MTAAKVPRRPPRELHHTAEDLVIVQRPVWRIHPTSGRHVLAWSQLREYGPVMTSRWDPQQAPPSPQPDRAVMYVAMDLRTAAAEVLQTTRTIDTSSRAPHATSWTPTRPWQLLDLTGDWPLRNGAASAPTAAPRTTCRAWAQAIHSQWPHLDGLLTRSTMTAEPMPVLYAHAADTFPTAPDFSEPLSAPLIWSVMQQAAASIGYGIR